MTKNQLPTKKIIGGIMFWKNLIQREKVGIYIFFIILLCMSTISFLLGYFYAKKDIVSYEKDGYLEVYPYNWPTYNLPLTEYSSLLKALQHGDVEEAKRRLEGFLNRAIKDANYRMLVANSSQKKIIGRALDKALDTMDNVKAVKGNLENIPANK